MDKGYIFWMCVPKKVVLVVVELQLSCSFS